MSDRKSPETRGIRIFPGWLEPLRPDDAVKRRLREAILARAEPILAARGRGGWSEVAAGWATLLAPAAAAAAILFAALAVRAGDSGPEAQVHAAVFEPVEAEASRVVPAVLTAESGPGAALVLTSTVYSEE